MRDAILVEKIIELMSIARIAVCQNTHAREFAIAAEPSPPHDQGIDDGFAHGRNFRQCAPKFCGRNVEYLRLIRCDSGGTEDRCPLEHGYVPEEIALTRGGEVIFDVVARLEGLEFTAQNNRQPNIALPSFKKHVTAFHHAAFGQRLKKRKLMIVQFWKRDTFGIAIKLFVLLFVGHLEKVYAKPKMNREILKARATSKAESP